MTSNLPDLTLAKSLRLSTRRIVGRAGHAPDSRYVEKFWLPILGPSTTLLIRHLDRRLDEGGEQVEVDLCDIGHALGLGERAGRHAPLLRSLRRAVDYDMIMPAGSDYPGGDAASTVRPFLVRRALPSLSPRLVARLAPELAREHYATCAASSVEMQVMPRGVLAHPAYSGPST